MILTKESPYNPDVSEQYFQCINRRNDLYWKEVTEKVALPFHVWKYLREHLDDFDHDNPDNDPWEEEVEKADFTFKGKFGEDELLATTISERLWEELDNKNFSTKELKKMLSFTPSPETQKELEEMTASFRDYIENCRQENLLYC